MEIGKPKRVYRVEPLVDPIPRRQEPDGAPPAPPVKPKPAPAK